MSTPVLGQTDSCPTCGKDIDVVDVKGLLVWRHRTDSQASPFVCRNSDGVLMDLNKVMGLYGNGVEW